MKQTKPKSSRKHNNNEPSHGVCSKKLALSTSSFSKSTSCIIGSKGASLDLIRNFFGCLSFYFNVSQNTICLDILNFCKSNIDEATSSFHSIFERKIDLSEMIESGIPVFCKDIVKASCLLLNIHIILWSKSDCDANTLNLIDYHDRSGLENFRQLHLIVIDKSLYYFSEFSNINDYNYFDESSKSFILVNPAKNISDSRFEVNSILKGSVYDSLKLNISKTTHLDQDYCDYCNELGNSFMCKSCESVFYCSTVCLKNDFDYKHSFECANKRASSSFCQSISSKGPGHSAKALASVGYSGVDDSQLNLMLTILMLTASMPSH